MTGPTTTSASGSSILCHCPDGPVKLTALAIKFGNETVVLFSHSKTTQVSHLMSHNNKTSRFKMKLKPIDGNLTFPLVN